MTTYYEMAEKLEKEKVMEDNKEYVELKTMPEEIKEYTLRDSVVNLLKIKSLVTLLLTAAFVYLSITGVVSGEQFIIIFTTVVVFYFGIQSTKESK